MTLLLHFCHSETAIGTLTRVACRLPAQTLSTTWEVNSVTHFCEEEKRGAVVGAEIFPLLWINQMSFGSLVSCSLLW